MKIEQAKEIAEKAIGQLAESLERGHSEELTKYLVAMARFPKYSLNNVCLILAQRPDAARVAGYHTWRQLGRQVNRGAKGILIFAPIVRQKSESKESGETPGAESVRLVGFRGIHVFAEEDTSGQPIPQLSCCSGDPAAFAERLKQFVTSALCGSNIPNRSVPHTGCARPEKSSCCREWSAPSNFPFWRTRSGISSCTLGNGVARPPNACAKPRLRRLLSWCRRRLVLRLCARPQNIFRCTRATKIFSLSRSNIFNAPARKSSPPSLHPTELSSGSPLRRASRPSVRMPI